MTRSPPSMSLLFLLLLSQLSLLVSATDSASNTVESLFDSAKGIKVGGSILAIAAIAAGAVMVVMGYRLFRATLFAVGFVAGGVVVAMVVEHIFDSKSWVVTASWIAFVVGGLICGGPPSVRDRVDPVAVDVLGRVLLEVAGGREVAGEVADAPDQDGGAEEARGDNQHGLLELERQHSTDDAQHDAQHDKHDLRVARVDLVAERVVDHHGERHAGRGARDEDAQRVERDDDAYLAGILVLFVLGLFVQFRKTARGGVYHKSRTVGRQTPNVQYVEAGTPQQNAHYGNPVSHV